MKFIAYIVICITLALFFWHCTAHPNNVFAGEKYFEISTKDTLHFFPSESVLKKRKLNLEDVSFILKSLQEEFSDFSVDSTNVFPRNKWSFGSKYEAYVVTYWSQNKRESRTYIHLYDKDTKIIEAKNNLRISESFGSEGAEGITHCWIGDFNEDGNIDILVRKKRKFSSLGNNGAEIIKTHDDFTGYLWGNSAFNEKLINFKKYDQSAEKQTLSDLKKDFDFYFFQN